MDQEQLQERLAALEAQIESLKAERAAGADGEPGPVEPGKIEELMAALEEIKAMIVAMTEEAPAAEPVPVVVAEAQEGEDAVVPDARVDALEAKLHLMECAELLRRKLDDSGLTPSHRRVVESAFAGKTFEEAELDRVIESTRTAQGESDPTGRITGAGSAGHVTTSPQDKALMGLMRLVWGPTKIRAIEANKDDRVLERMPEAFGAWINAGRPNYNPRSLSNWIYENTLSGTPFQPDWRWREGISLTYAIQDAVNIVLAHDYTQRSEWWKPIVDEMEVDTIDDVHLVRLFGLGDLPVVAEGGPYLPLDMDDQEETGTYEKRGGYVGVSREDVLRDKIGAIASIPQRLANTWYNTQSALVSAVFTANSGAGPVLVDTGALFNATAVTTTGGHANLGSTALSFSSFEAAATAMLKQSDQNESATERLLIPVKYLLVPVDLRGTALRIRNSEKLPGVANNDDNPYYQSFDVVIVPRWTDTNNWAIMGDPAQYPSIHMIYPRGGRTPQIFTADDERSGAMFTNDEMRFKARLEVYQEGNGTYECAPVSDFRALYNNVVS